jgi:hypothetical protein
MPCFSYYLLCFFFYNIGEQEGGTGSDGGLWHWWEGRGGGESGRRMNMVQITYIHVFKCKNDTC